jgi:hypothetical protein
MGRTLVATMTGVGNRTRAAPLLDWLQGSCVRLGTNAATRRLSLLNHNLEPTAPDARVVKWMQTKVAHYLKYAAPTAPPAEGAEGPGRVPILPIGTNRTGEREYSLLATSKIQAACGITDAQWETDLLELYTRMLEEGRTTAKVTALLEDNFRPDDNFSLAAVQINVTDELAKDIKNINLGYNNDMSYRCCHRGISPFAMIGVSMAMASKRRRMANRFTRTNNLTLAEVSMTDTTPDPIPTGYHEAVNLLRRYAGLLQHVVGGRCEHHTMVRQIAAELF